MPLLDSWKGVRSAERCPDNRTPCATMPSMNAPISRAVRASNTLTGRWCALLGDGDGDFVASGAGLWPLLALLASAADEPARADLAVALGSDVAFMHDALDLIRVLREGGSTTAALGVWARTGTPLREEWASGLPDGVVGTLTDQDALDRWAADETLGLIEHFPVRINDSTALVIASALATKIRWRTPFDSSPRDGDVSNEAPAEQWLVRTTSDLSAAAVLDETVTRVVVEGDGDVDVHLVLGDGLPPADVLDVGLRELSGEARVQAATDIVGEAPGLTVRRDTSNTPHDQLLLRLPSFEIRMRHDLLDFQDAFGLGALTDPTTSHLPALSPEPLFITEGAQEVLARFFAEGFEAAAVTAFAMMATGAPSFEEHTITSVTVTIDQPFGFVAVHRPSRLAVVAGWVGGSFSPNGL